MIELFVWLIVIGVLAALAFYVIGAIPVPEPLGRIIKMVIVVVACLAIIVLLLRLTGVSMNGLSVPQVSG